MGRRPADGRFWRMEESSAFSNVIVGVDGREGGRDAVALARQLAAPGAQITLAHIYNSEWAVAKASGTGVPLGHEDVDRLLQGERTATGIEADLVSMAATPPARGLHELAERRQANLLVVGSSRYAMLGRVLIGNVTRTTFHGVPCAIAVAPYRYARAEHPLRKVGVATTARLRAKWHSVLPEGSPPATAHW